MPRRAALPAMTCWARVPRSPVAFGASHGGFGSGGPDGFGPLGFGQDRFGTNGAQSRSMTGREALLGSSFTATGEKDGTGGSLAFWGPGGSVELRRKGGDVLARRRGDLGDAGRGLCARQLAGRAWP